MTILELENLTGLDRATIRYYEREGLITPSRKENSYRDYSLEDANEILKIKLLRQLDVSIETIRNLQQGSVDITSVLRLQVTALESQIADKERAAVICKEISAAEVTYQSLDASQYLNRLKAQPEPVNPQPNIISEDAAPIYRYLEYHPVRRFVARMTDYALLQCIVRFMLIVVFRIRPFGDFLSYVVTYGCLLASVPLHAWMLSVFGSTPGKWAMGIQVLSYEGKRLSFGAAIEREWAALKYGYGFGIPFYSLWRLYKSYKSYANKEIIEQDMGVEHLYSRSKVTKNCVFAVICLFIITINCVIGLDAVKPKHRGTDLTVAQFAENFNFYAENFEYDFSMNPDGTWYDPQIQNGGYVVIEIDKADKPKEPFRFEKEGESITRISYSNSWQDIAFVTPVGPKMITAMVTAIMSQENLHLLQLKDILYEVSDYAGQNSANVTFENIQIRWNIIAENCSNYNGTFYTIDKAQPSRLELEFEIIINEE